jgi:hypothetical protein
MLIAWKDKTFYMSKLWTQNLDRYIDGVLNKNTSAVFIFDGRSGLGKTTLSFQTGCYIANKVAEKFGKKPNFTLNNVSWTPDDFLEKLQNAQKGDVIILDESMILSNRSSMSEVNRAIVIMMSMIRSKQIFVFFNANSLFDLDKNLPLHRADVLIHLYAENDRFASRGRYIVIPSAKGKLKNLYIVGKKYYDYSKAKVAFRDKFTAFFPFSEREYEKQKQFAINNYFDKSPVGGKLKDSRDSLVKYLKNELLISNDDLANAANVSVRTIQRILS